LLLELTPPVCIIGKGVPVIAGGGKGVGGAHSSIDTGDNITPEERRGPAVKNFFKGRSKFQLATSLQRNVL